MGRLRFTRFVAYTFLSVSLLSLGLVLSCGGGGPSGGISTGSNGTVNTTITDPPACKVSFDHVYVTITKVTANLAANADSNDGGWQTLVDLTDSPKQIDLLSLADSTCVLTQLGTATLPTGTYQQIRLYLLSNNPTGNAATPSSNACGSAGYNCVVRSPALPNGPTNPPEELLLSSQAQTGIKIPSSQITSGGLTVDSGQTTGLNIDFNTCSSLVRQGNGMWRLKPVLHAGEASTNSNALSGTVVDSASQSPIAGAVVSLEQADNGIDVVTDSTTTDATGNFSFCGSYLLADATYDVVVTKLDTSGATPLTYNATVTLDVPVGSSLGNIPLVAEPTQVNNATVIPAPANVVGQVTTTAHSTTTGAMAADATGGAITITALQDAGGGRIVTIPPFVGSSAGSFVTAATPSVSNGTSADTCPTGTYCENYSLLLPASNPSVGTFAAGQTTSYSTPAANPALYWLMASSVLPTDTATADCTPSIIPSSLTPGESPTGNQIGVEAQQAPTDNVVQDFEFVACTAGQ